MTPDLDTSPATDAHLHDAECEATARDRGEIHWPHWRSCLCKSRREGRSRLLDERPVRFSWLQGPREDPS